MNSNVPALSKGVTRLENAIVTLSGPALATSGIIAGVDILTNNLIARYAPGAGAIAGLIWAICLMLTLDFQVLMLGVRARRIYASCKKGGWQKTSELTLCVAIAAALGYVSLQMGSIFAHMLGTSLTITQAQADLGINPIALIYERSALVLLLIFISGWLRHDTETVEASTPTPVAPAPTTVPVPAVPDWREMLQEFAKMQQVTIERTIETVMERVTITQVPQVDQASTPLQIEAPAEAQNALANAPVLVDKENEQAALTTGRFASKEQAVAHVLARNPNATIEQVAAEAGCNPRTAEKWYRRLKPGDEQ